MRVTVDISREDYEQFRTFLGTVSYWCDKPSVAQVLGQFVADLAATEHSAGSDERSFAREYFDRTWARVV